MILTLGLKARILDVTLKIVALTLVSFEASVLCINVNNNANSSSNINNLIACRGFLRDGILQYLSSFGLRLITMSLH